MSQDKVKQADRSPGRPAGTYAQDSLPSRLAAMTVGQTETSVVRIPTMSSGEKSDRTSAKRNHEGKIRKAVERAVERTGYQYEMESGMFISHLDNIVLVIAVTRVK